MSPQARRASPIREPAGMTVTSRTPSDGSATPTPEPPPNAPVTATMTCHASPSNTVASSARTVHRSGAGRDRRVEGAGGVGERAEPRLERVGAARGDRREPGAGDVDERVAVAEAAELVAAQLRPGDRELRRRDAVARQPGGAREVVRGARRDHAERDAEPRRDLGDAGDRAVAARDDDAVDVRDLLAVPERDLGDLRAAPLHGGDERPGLEPAPRVPVRDQRNAHARSVPSARICSGTMPDLAIGTRSG